MKQNCKMKHLYYYVFLVVLLIITGITCLALNKIAYANNTEDFYSKCVTANSAEELNYSSGANAENFQNEADFSYEKYIKSHLNKKYCCENKFSSATLIILKQTLADNSKLPLNATLNDIHYGNYFDSEIAMFDEYCVLYDVDELSKYYVGYVNTMDGEVQDYVFAKTNYNGEVLNDCIYDSKTGLIYVPKAYTKNKGADNRESVLEVQMQTLISVNNNKEKVSTTVDIAIEEDGEDLAKTNIKVNALDTFLVIPSAGVDLTNASVIANDNIEMTNKSYFDNGNIYINESPTNIKNIKIKTKKTNFIKDLFNTSEKPRLSTSLDDIPCLPYTLNKDLPATSGGFFNYVGAKYNAIMTVHYDETPSSAPYQECLYGVRGFISDESMQTFANCIWNDAGDVDLSNLEVVSNRIYNLFTFVPDNIIKERIYGLALKCGHIGTPAAHDGDNKEVRSKILAINEQAQYALLAFVTATAGFTGQGACGIYKVKYESKGGCQMSKDSTLEWSKTNPNYSLEGAQYDIYNDERCTSYTGFSIVLNKDGNGHTDINVLEAKRTYYVKENASNTGTHYLHNNTVGSVYIENTNSYSNQVVWNTGTITYDTPVSDLAPVKIAKADAQTGEAGVTEGNVPSFENAYYDFSYYSDYFRKKTEIQSHSSSYQRHWIMATDKNGMTSLSEQYRWNKVGGDEFFENENAQVACPLGTYVIKETKAPEGYLLSEKYYIIQITWENGEIANHVYDADFGSEIQQIIDVQGNYFKAFEQIKRGDYKFIKTDENMRELSGIPFKITSQTTGEWHIVVSDTNGVIDTSSKHVLHTNKTNNNDSLYDPVLRVITDESLLDSDSGCWFAFDKKTSKIASPEDEVGALPYDTYTIEELLISKNEKYYPFGQRSFVISTNDYDIEGGTWVNSKNTCVTKARGTSGEQEIEARANEKVYDRVFYGGLINGNQYEVKACLVEQSSGDIVDLNRQNATDNYVHSSFIANDSIGYVDIEASIDSRPYIDKTLVWFVEIYDYDFTKLIIDHKDIIDAEESLYVVGPSFETDLCDKFSAEKIIDKRTDEVLVDKITYSKLIPGYQYTFHGTLYNKELRSPLVDNVSGEMITATCNFIPSMENGSEYIVYELDTSILKDNTELVSCVDLYNEDVCLRSCTSLEDERETVVVTKPYIKTKASTLNNDKSIVIDKNTSISDLISYNNFCIGEDFSIYSWFVYNDTGIPVTDNLISNDDALETISAFLEIFDGNLIMANNLGEGSSDYKDQWLVEFFNAPNKIDLEKLNSFDWDSLKHIMFSKDKHTPTNRDGATNIDFKFDTSSCREGKIVAYTIIVLDDTLLLANTDINDEDETLMLVKNEPPAPIPGVLAKTSDNILPILIVTLLLFIATVCFFRRFRLFGI